MLLGALGVLLLGAVPPAMADSPPPPCHKMAAMGHRDATSKPGAPQPDTPDKPMKSMPCCVACVAAPAITPPDRSGITVRPTSPQPAVRALPVGLRLTPETGPPKA